MIPTRYRHGNEAITGGLNDRARKMSPLCRFFDKDISAALLRTSEGLYGKARGMVARVQAKIDRITSLPSEICKS